MPYKTNSGSPQCHNREIYELASNYCNHASRCVKFREDHSSDARDKASQQSAPYVELIAFSITKDIRRYKAIFKRRNTNQSNRLVPNNYPRRAVFSPVKTKLLSCVSVGSVFNNIRISLKSQCVN